MEPKAGTYDPHDWNRDLPEEFKFESGTRFISAVLTIGFVSVLIPVISSLPYGGRST